MVRLLAGASSARWRRLQGVLTAVLVKVVARAVARQMVKLRLLEGQLRIYREVMCRCCRLGRWAGCARPLLAGRPGLLQIQDALEQLQNGW